MALLEDAKMKKVLILTALLGLMVASAGAAMVEGDIVYIQAMSTSNNGTTQATLANGIWNRTDLTDLEAGAELDLADGTDEGVNITRVTSTNLTKNNAHTTRQRTLSWVPSDSMSQNFQCNASDGAQIEFYISGLSTDFTYDINFTAGGNTSAYDGQSVAVNGVTGTNGANYSPYQASQDGQSGVLEVTWAGLSLDSNDRLTFVVDGNENDRPSVGMIRIEAVPEPATMGLLAIGGIGMLIRRKR